MFQNLSLPVTQEVRDSSGVTPCIVMKKDVVLYHQVSSFSTESMRLRSHRQSTGSCILRQFLTSYVISVASDIEREKSDKFCSVALFSAWGSFTCRKSTTRDPRLYFSSKRSHTQDFYALKKIHRPRPGSNLRTSDPEACMITTGPPGSTLLQSERTTARDSVQHKRWTYLFYRTVNTGSQQRWTRWWCTTPYKHFSKGGK